MDKINQPSRRTFLGWLAGTSAVASTAGIAAQSSASAARPQAPAPSVSNPPTDKLPYVWAMFTAAWQALQIAHLDAWQLIDLSENEQLGEQFEHERFYELDCAIDLQINHIDTLALSYGGIDDLGALPQNPAVAQIYHHRSQHAKNCHGSERLMLALNLALWAYEHIQDHYETDDAPQSDEPYRSACGMRYALRHIAGIIESDVHNQDELTVPDPAADFNARPLASR